MKDFRNVSKKSGQVLLYLILPILFFSLSMLFKSEMGYYHLFGTDAEYAYLTNGLNLCYLELPYHVQGPGTPLHMFSAIVIKITHLFRNHGSLVEDVMKNPDVYINSLILSLTILTTILLFILGVAVGEKSRNILAGLFIQFTPFSSWQTLDLMRRYMLENMIIVAVLFLIIILFIFLYKENLSERSTKKYVILFSIATGFIAATKLMYLPIAIIPFFVIPGYKNKLRFVFISVVAFCILAFAIFHRWQVFWGWHVQNFVHAGQYGSGASSVIDPTLFLNNLKSLFASAVTFRISYFLLLAGSILYHLPFLKVKTRDDKPYLALVGILITMTVMTLLVAKQMKFYYMITTVLLEVPGLYLLMMIFTRPLPRLPKVAVMVALAGFMITKFYGETMIVYNSHEQNSMRRENYLEPMRYISSQFKVNQPTLIIPDYYGAPYKEYGIYFGINWCGPVMASRYASTLQNLYPEKYIYNPWNNQFNSWTGARSYIGLLKKYGEVVLYVGDKTLEQAMNSKFHGLNRKLDTKWAHIKSFPAARADFYTIQFDSLSAAKSYAVLFDAERRDSSKFSFLSEDGLIAGNGSTQSAEYAHSGKQCSKLSKETPYGFTTDLGEIQAGEQYEISVWRYNNGNSNAGLVVSGNTPGKLYLVQAGPVKEEKGWQKIVYELNVTEQLAGEDVKIYLWNMDANQPAYFDDLRIERLAYTSPE